MRKIWFNYINETELIEKYFNNRYSKRGLEVNRIGWLKAHFTEINFANSDEAVIDVINVMDLKSDGKERIKLLIESEAAVILVNNSDYIVVKIPSIDLLERFKEKVKEIRKEYSRKYIKFLKIAVNYLAVILLCIILTGGNPSVPPVISVDITFGIIVAIALVAIVFCKYVEYYKTKKEIISTFDVFKFEKMMNARVLFRILGSITFFICFSIISNYIKIMLLR